MKQHLVAHLRMSEPKLIFVVLIYYLHFGKQSFLESHLNTKRSQNFLELMN